MKLFYCMFVIFCLLGANLFAGDYIRLGSDSIPVNSDDYDLVFYVERTCPNPSMIKGAQNGFVITASGDVTYQYVDFYQDAGSSIDWDLAFIFTNLIDNNPPDTFVVSAAAMMGGMPIISDEPYFHLILDIGLGEGLLCFDSSFIVGPSAEWIWNGLTCGLGGDAERPLFVDKYGSDANHPICITVYDIASICGDANNDDGVNVSDGVWIINYVFAGGAPPDPLASGDVNCDATCNISDAVWIINFIFAGGYDPCDPNGDQVPDCDPNNPLIIDIDGNTYRTVKIGDRWWMAENLKVTHYSNGDPIPNVSDDGEWIGLSTGAYCEYDNDPANVDTYGRLYNWFAVDDSRNIAPAGWHVPTDAEYKQLEMYLGMSQAEADNINWRGTDEGGKLKETGTTHWNPPNTGANNESGFTGLPGGFRDSENGYFFQIGTFAHFWSSTEDPSLYVWYRSLSCNLSKVMRDFFDKQMGYSVRCVKECTGTVTDIDGNVYQTIQIGDQWWMAENLKVTHYRNGDLIPNVTDDGEWSGLSTGAYCDYDNDPANVDTYGRLYNWYAVDDSRNIAPEGWHVPTDAELKQLEMYLGMSQAEADATSWRGTDEGGKLKEAGTAHWNSPNTGATNESGFTALPGGERGYSGVFIEKGDFIYFWSSSEENSVFHSAWSRTLGYNSQQVRRYGDDEDYGYSVRCVRD